MDPLSRVLASIGQSLGKGLGQVGQVEAERKLRLEQIQEQSKANLGSRLFEELVKAPNTEGFNLLSDEDRQLFSTALVSLGAGKYDDSMLNGTVKLLGKVAANTAKVAQIRDLVKQGNNTVLGGILSNISDDEAARLMQLAGLPEGSYQAFREMYQLEKELKGAGIDLTQAQIRNLQTATERMKTLLPAELDKLKAEGALTDEQVNQLRTLLPEQLKLLAAQAQGEKIKAENLQDEIRAKIRQTLASAGVEEAQREDILAKLTPSVQQILAQVNLLQQQAGLVGAQTKQVETETELTKKRIDEIEQVMGIRLQGAQRDNVDAVSRWVDKNPNATKEQVMSLLTVGAGAFDPDRAGTIADFLIAGSRRLNEELTLNLDEKKLAVLKSASEVYNVETPQGRADWIEFVTKKLGYSRETAESLANRELVKRNMERLMMDAKTYEIYTNMQPPTNPEQRKNALSRVWQTAFDSCVQSKGSNCEAKANALRNSIASDWDLKMTLQDLAKQGKMTDIEAKKAEGAYYRAHANLYNAQAGAIPTQLAMDKERLAIEWDRNAIDWARLALDKDRLDLELKKLSQQTGMDVKDLKDLVSTLGTLSKSYFDVLGSELTANGYSDCGTAVAGSATGATIGVEGKITGLSEKCQEAVKTVLAKDGSIAARTLRSINAISSLLPTLELGGGNKTNTGGGGGSTGALGGQKQARTHLSPDRIREAARKGTFSSADIGYAAAVLPVEGGVGTPNGPLQLVSFSDIRENCQKQWGNDPTALALCQGRGMVGKYGFEQTHLWNAAATHFYGSAKQGNNFDLDKPIAPEHDKANPVFRRFSGKGPNEPVTLRDVAATYTYYHLNTYKDIWTKRLPEATPAFQNDAGLRNVAFALTFLPEKKGGYGPSDIAAAWNKAFPNAEKKPEGEVLTALAALANQLRLDNIGKTLLNAGGK